MINDCCPQFIDEKKKRVIESVCISNYLILYNILYYLFIVQTRIEVYNIQILAPLAI